MTRREDLAWAAGLFEGEGCFTTNGPAGHGRAQLAMTDEDIVVRFSNIMGWRVRPHKTRAGAKPEWRAEVATFEGFQASAAAMWEWLGPRRRARAAFLLNNWPNKRQGYAVPA